MYPTNVLVICCSGVTRCWNVSFSKASNSFFNTSKNVQCICRIVGHALYESYCWNRVYSFYIFDGYSVVEDISNVMFNKFNYKLLDVSRSVGKKFVVGNTEKYMSINKMSSNKFR